MEHRILKKENEGGCGVIGLASSKKIAGRHLLPALKQMCNRGNGKGGGIAAAGLSPEAFGISSSLLEKDFLLAIAYLDKSSQSEVERTHISSLFEIDHIHVMPHRENSRMAISPPEVICYFVRVKAELVDHLSQKHRRPLHEIEEEIVIQNSHHLNQTFYTATGEKRAFVLSHGKDMLVLKTVGFADDVIHAYQMEDFRAHVWIGHHRYPTKGRVWHPGGAHPFVGMHEALVHNGDFANYYSICEYLAQRKIYPLFLTDTEVSVLVFDLLYRTYGYPLEYVIEALAPTTERDFSLLPEEKQRIYQQLQQVHMHASPDGPWFFLIAQTFASSHQKRGYRLIGITDTSMLRPQVFALQEGSTISIGLAASEKQAIDATLSSLSKEDSRYCSRADRYWCARGGSHTDGGAFVFTVTSDEKGKVSLTATDKFGHPVQAAPSKPQKVSATPALCPELPLEELLPFAKNNLQMWNAQQAQSFLTALLESAVTDDARIRALNLLTQLLDQRFPLRFIKRSVFLSLLDESLTAFARAIERHPTLTFAYMSASKKGQLEASILVVDATDFPSEGETSLAREIVCLYKQGFKHFVILNCRGQRFLGSGLGAHSHGLRIDVYGSSGDYLGSGIDGAQIHVHGSGQDQLAQIMKEGTLVVHGDVGQTFMYGAKGGVAFVRGNAAGRPLINGVGKARAIINGTCLDYLAESFMAGDPLQEGGFVIVNGLTEDEEGTAIDLETPYPGNNLFSLASGGAIYLRDPDQKVTEEQLNGGIFTPMTQQDWELILPYLRENERLFGISVDRLLEKNEKPLNFQQAYRKIRPAPVRALHEEEAWVKKVANGQA